MMLTFTRYGPTGTGTGTGPTGTGTPPTLTTYTTLTTVSGSSTSTSDYDHEKDGLFYCSTLGLGILTVISIVPSNINIHD